MLPEHILKFTNLTGFSADDIKTLVKENGFEGREEHAAIWLSQNTTLPQLLSSPLDPYLAQFIVYSKFSHNANFPHDIEVVADLKQRRLINSRDLIRNKYVPDHILQVAL